MPVEDFLLYTEVDPSSRIVINTSRVTFTNFPRSEDAKVYDDKGVAHFDGDFEHLITFRETAETNGIANIWQLTNVIVTQKPWAQGVDGLSLAWEAAGGAGATPILRLIESVAGSVTQAPSIILAHSTTYYLTIERDESVGFGTLTVFIYSDSGRTILVDTVSITLNEKEDFRYIYPLASWNDGPADTVSGFTENLDLQEVVAAGVGIITVAIAPDHTVLGPPASGVGLASRRNDTHVLGAPTTGEGFVKGK